MEATTRVPAVECPHCGETLDAATGLEDGATPDPGDMSICCACGTILMFGQDLLLLEPTRDQLKQVYAEQPGLEDMLTRMQRMARKLNQ